jgi:hypothetical protein
LRTQDAPGSRSDVRSGINNTDNPTIVRGVRCALVVWNAELRRKREILCG